MKIARGLVAYVSGRIAKLSPDAVRLETPSAILGGARDADGDSRRGAVKRAGAPLWLGSTVTALIVSAGCGPKRVEPAAPSA